MNAQIILHVAGTFLVGLTLGGMVFFSFIMAPLVHRKLERADARRLIGEAFPVYFRIMAIFTVLAALVLAGSPEGVATGLVAIFFLFSLLWILPRVQKQMAQASTPAPENTEGSPPASGGFIKLHSLSVIINMIQLLVIAGVLVSLAAR